MNEWMNDVLVVSSIQQHSESKTFRKYVFSKLEVLSFHKEKFQAQYSSCPLIFLQCVWINLGKHQKKMLYIIIYVCIYINN